MAVMFIDPWPIFIIKKGLTGESPALQVKLFKLITVALHHGISLAFASSCFKM
tara:strand:- start:43 stop:201 length:159 start_codon:yes stop_codon:yes gene_type:complete